jgi:hypothetical protein
MLTISAKRFLPNPAGIATRNTKISRHHENRVLRFEPTSRATQLALTVLVRSAVAPSHFRSSRYPAAVSPIEKWFASSATGRAFCHCADCRMPLIETDAPWVVNKDYRDGRCVLEYAVCEPCRDRLMDAIPESTKEKIRHFLETEIDWATRCRDNFGQRDDEGRFNSCIRCGEPRAGLADFAISARFHSNGAPDIGPLPLLICRPCYSRLSALLCNTSREVWQRFLTEHIDGDPPDDLLGLF